MRSVFVLVNLLGCVLGQDVPTAKIPQGSVVGSYKKSYGGRTFSAFEGIPYAKPPVDDLRFAEPEPAEPWDDVLVANKTYTCMCFVPFPMIYGIYGTEDCLYVHVYVPRETIDENENLEVIVNIHGGAFMLGAPHLMAGPDYIMDQDVIYVNFNYRLGILGFLSTEDNVVSGNNGLKDQSLALKWIKDNIKHFGGNPDSITLTGLSAGGASVHYHYLSPRSEGLFHRGLSQSGTALQPWALTEEPLAKAKAVATSLNCSTESSSEMVDCLKKVPGKELIKAIKVLLVYMDAVPFTIFGPVVEKGDNPFLPDHPYKILKEGKVYDVPWIVSNVKEEGIFPVGFIVLLNKLAEIDERWNELMPYALDIQDTVDKADYDDVVNKVRKYYLQDEPVTKDNVYSLVQLFTDRIYMIDSEIALRAHAMAVKSPVYFYFFTYVDETPFMFRGMRKGVAHSFDGKLMFKLFGNPRKFEKDDQKMMELMTEFITVYAKKSTPSFGGIEWQPVSPGAEELDFLHIASPDEISMKKIDEFAPSKFWNSLPIHENNKM